ncbi:MAG: hypothetical protein LBU27_05400 [Candidatus Peribacteria bacterium]|jgi:hypothetical protein|nr:hypothetical protein [Candidatus Peribacteria bacterium]
MSDEIKALQETKEGKENDIKKLVEQLAQLSDEAKETTKEKIKALEDEREAELKKLITKIENELTNTQEETEKIALQELLERYAREEWENQSYYVGVIAIVEQDLSDSGKALKRKLQTKQKENVEQQETRTTISTYELLQGSTTADKLKTALSNSALDKRFKNLGVDTNPEKRLEKTLERAHEVAKQFVEWKLFDNEAEKAQNPELLTYCHEVIAP